ncbi:Polyketide transferase [Lasiodiplodia hormozganensis]|uniref:Polyketide transferase n=1 Tax=Lasiodiplodia hormozganensis TaxID=869390 RepID=A0AA39XPM1_9PEZI|nr:Polyketide transferase [Lasiodiplodia hormozganensis]
MNMAQSRRDVEFRTLDGTLLKGWFYPAAAAAENPEQKSPCIIMSHSLSGLKEQFLPAFASRFSAHGYAVLIYDNRNWGSSGGHPRNEADPWKQAHDYSDAFDYAASTQLPGVDARRIVFWGSSLSGGTAIVAAAMDRRVKAVIVQVPFVSGEGTAAAMAPLLPAVYADRQANKDGGAGSMVPTIATSPEEERRGHSRAILHGPGVAEFLETMRADGVGWETKMTMQSVQNLFMFEPQAFIHRVAPTPLLMVLADSDTMVPTVLQLKAYSTAYEPKTIAVLTDCTHFDLYYGEKFEENVAVQLGFLRRVFHGGDS